MPTLIDTDALKRDYPVADVIAHYGIELRPSGRSLIGRCPFHADGGRPNLHVYVSTQSWYCFRCGVGGDVIRFVQLAKRVGFRQAVEQLLRGALPTASNLTHVVKMRNARSMGPVSWGAAERACLAAAVELYHNRLLNEPAAFDYVKARGLDDTTVERYRVGFASGNELVAYLRWRRLPIQAAIRVGLLTRRGREFLDGRVIVPEIRHGQPIWLIGRVIEARASAPKYLGLPGRKPVFGWETASKSRVVTLVEGPFDWLTLRQWGVPALALMGTHPRSEALKALTRFERIYLALDNDEAGREATADMVKALGRLAIPVSLPGVKDVAELGTRHDGRACFVHAVQIAEQTWAATSVRRDATPLGTCPLGWRPTRQRTCSEQAKEVVSWHTV